VPLRYLPQRGRSRLDHLARDNVRVDNGYAKRRKSIGDGALSTADSSGQRHGIRHITLSGALRSGQAEAQNCVRDHNENSQLNLSDCSLNKVKFAVLSADVGRV